MGRPPTRLSVSKGGATFEMQQSPTSPTPMISTTTSRMDSDKSNGYFPAKNVQHAHQQQQQPPQRQPRVLRFWLWELSAMILAFGLMGAIIGVLVRYHGQELPEWPWAINMNTLIALLTNLFRAALLLVVAEVLGQARWIWFSERVRPLHHVQTFEDAGRSVLGSLRLSGLMMWRGGTSGSALAMAAALITIISFAIGPFTQQAIRTATCPQILTTVNSSLPVAHHVPGTSSYFHTGPLPEVEVDMRAVGINGLTNPNSKDTAITCSCPTGNCTFPEYGNNVTHASIGMCSRCFDTSSMVTAPDKGGNMTLPDKDVFINIGPYTTILLNVGFSNLTWATDLFPSGFDTIAGTALYNVTILAATINTCTTDSQGYTTCPRNTSAPGLSAYAGNMDYVAASCSLYPCMRSYFAQVNDGVLTETLLSTTPAIKNSLDVPEEGYTELSHNYTTIQSPCLLDGIIYTTANMSSAPRVPGRTFANITLPSGTVAEVPNACLYKMGGIYGAAMSNFLSDTLHGRCSYQNSQAGHIFCSDSWWLTPLYNNRNASFASISLTLDELATAVTNLFRTTGNGPDVPRDDSLSGVRVLGLVEQASVCLYMDWRWLLMPAGAVLWAALLLGLMIVRNYAGSEQPVWKGSVLPLLFYGLQGQGGPGQSQKQAWPVMNLDQVEEEAARMRVRFSAGVEPGFHDTNPACGPGREFSSESLLDGKGKR